jgi:hypothetical protein
VLAVSVPLTIGLLLGSWFGPPVVRRLPANLLRIGIGLAGLGLPSPWTPSSDPAAGNWSHLIAEGR